MHCSRMSAKVSDVIESRSTVFMLTHKRLDPRVNIHMHVQPVFTLKDLVTHRTAKFQVFLHFRFFEHCLWVING